MINTSALHLISSVARPNYRHRKLHQAVLYPGCWAVWLSRWEAGQATEVIKELLGIGKSLSGQMMAVDELNNTIRRVKLPRDPAFTCCGGR